MNQKWKLRLANGAVISGNGALPEIWVQNDSSEDGGGSSGRSNYNNGYRMDVIKINKNTNENTGATVTVNAASEEAPGDGSESEAEQEEPGNGSESEESGKSP